MISDPRPADGLRQLAREAVRIRLLALLDIPRLEQRLARNEGAVAQLAAAHHETRLLATAAPSGTAVPPRPPGRRAEEEQAFRAAAAEIVARHDAQTAARVTELQARYATPTFGTVPVYSLIERLGQCVDPTDCRLFGASQLTHVLQVIEAMEADGVLTPDLLLAALVHDLGKLLLLTDEDPANVVGMNFAIGEHADGVGLDNVVTQWSHDELGYVRLVDHVPDHIAWLVRHHSTDPVAHRHLMDERDRRYADAHLEVFFHYDHDSKSAFHVPRTRLEDYREVIDAAFPDPIPF